MLKLYLNAVLSPRRGVRELYGETSVAAVKASPAKSKGLNRDTDPGCSNDSPGSLRSCTLP